MYKRQIKDWEDEFFNDSENGQIKRIIRSGIPLK
jgi:hypothetical protein